MDDDREHTARSRQLARLPLGKKPPGPRAALAMAKSKAYQAAADAPATLRAYKTDLENFKAWFKSPRQVQRFLSHMIRSPTFSPAAPTKTPPRSFIPPATKPSAPGLR
jgi:hypothetical protein